MNQELEMIRLLVVDDEAGIRESLKDYFELEGYQVSMAQSGNEALALLKSEKFQVIVSDIRMPDGDGRFLLKSVRQQHPISPAVILMSGYSDLSVEEAMGEGAFATLIKPFHPADLLKVVKKSYCSPSERWKSQWETHKILHINVDAKNLSEALDTGLLKLGLNGAFLQRDTMGFRVGDEVELDFKDPAIRAYGILRWVRSSDQQNRARGMGIEFAGFTENFKKQFLKLTEDTKSCAIIPRA